MQLREKKEGKRGRGKEGERERERAHRYRGEQYHIERERWSDRFLWI